jgi:hypothetical protein
MRAAVAKAVEAALQESGQLPIRSNIHPSITITFIGVELLEPVMSVVITCPASAVSCIVPYGA